MEYRTIDKIICIVYMFHLFELKYQHNTKTAPSEIIGFKVFQYCMSILKNRPLNMSNLGVESPMISTWLCINTDSNGLLPLF